jgi:NitT/TauT family transport system ATP-binding protein
MTSADTPSDPDAGMTGLAVRLRGVTKIYDNGVAALGPFDLDVRRGEFLSLLGPSGCGKSTALRLIAGLATQTSGTVRVARRQAETGGTHAIGFVFQEPTLMPWADVADNVRLPLKLAHMPAKEADDRVMAALSEVGLAEFAKSYPRELSGGMKMRVCAGARAGHRSEILLMDEPFAALDEITRFRLNNDLLALWRTCKTVIFVTHSVFESVYLSERVIGMSARPGRISAEFRIDAADPRNEEFRTSASYAGFCRQVSAALAPAYQDSAHEQRCCGAAQAKSGQASHCGSCCPSSCSYWAWQRGSSWYGSTTSSPMCCRGHGWCRQRWSPIGVCCGNRCWSRS